MLSMGQLPSAATISGLAPGSMLAPGALPQAIAARAALENAGRAKGKQGSCGAAASSDEAAAAAAAVGACRQPEAPPAACCAARRLASRLAMSTLKAPGIGQAPAGTCGVAVVDVAALVSDGGLPVLF